MFILFARTDIKADEFYKKIDEKLSEGIIPSTSAPTIGDAMELIEKLIDDGEDVVLISDMYLPKELIVKMLGKVSEKIAKLPLFLSSEYKVQKTTARLYFEVYNLLV